MKKKILSLLLAVVMLVSVLPMSAISAYATAWSSASGTVQVTQLKAGDYLYKGTKLGGNTWLFTIDGSYKFGLVNVDKCYYVVSASTGNARVELKSQHDYAAATCTTAKTCKGCATTSGSALGHDYTNYRDGGQATAATCTTAATHYKMCSRCTSKSGTYSYGSALGHSYTVYQSVSTAATCTADRVDNYKCSRCTATTTKTATNTKLGHEYTKQGSLVSEATCTTKAVYNKQCTRCTSTSGTMEVGEPLGHNIVGGVCTRCEEIFVDFTAYDTALAEVDKLDLRAYTADSIAEYKDAVEKAKVDKSSTNQIETNNAIAKILSAKTLLNKKECSVKVYLVDDNSSTLIDTATVSYGDIYNASVSLADNQRVYKWTMRNNGNDSRLNTKDTFVSQVINGDTILHCFVNDEPYNHYETSRVVFYDKSNKVISIGYVQVGATVSTADVTAPEVAFYRFNGWEVVKGDPSNAPVSGVEFRAKYEYSQAQANQVLIVGVGDVKVNGKSEYKAYYDEVLNLTGAESFAYGDSTGTVLDGISGNYIYAPNNQKTIYIVAGVSSKATTKLTGWVDDNNKITVNAQYYLPSDCSFVEAGVKVAKTAEDVKTGSKFKSELQGETGEYSISMGYGSSKGTLHFASYLVYTDNTGKQITIYSDAEPISFGA